nr:T9SS type B sorting domain-containing protein [Paludibacteraceae bacterium]
KVIGNDIAIDDITFSTCSPEIQVFSNAEYTKKDQTFETEKTERVYVWAPYDLTEFFANPWYVIQESPDGTSNWTTIHSGHNDYKDVDITLDRYRDKKYYYRAFVAADQKTAEERADNPTVLQTGCGQISAVSDTLWLTMKKPCTVTDAPIVTNYDECPLTGTGTLADLVTSDKTNLRWYTQATGGTALTTTTFDWTTVGTRTFYVTNQLADQGTTTYCESTRTPVTINIKPSVAFTVDKTEINVCTNSKNAERTFTVSNKLPTSATITWKAMSDLSVLGTGNTYTVPATVGQGELLVEGTDPTGCDFSDTVRYEVKVLPDFTLTAPTMVCVSAPSATLTANITTDENGSTYTWYKGTNQVATGTLVAETSITHTDPTVGTTQGNVTYRLVIDNGICQTEKTATIVVKPDVTFTVDKSDINVCTNSTNAERTFTVSNKLPTSATITWKAMSDLSVLGTGNTYTVPATVGQGELLVEGTDPTGCDFSDTVRYEVKVLPDFTLTAPTMVCVSAPSATLTANITTDENGSTYTWYKGTNQVATGTLVAETSITHTDPTVGTTQGDVTYRLVINNGICEAEKTVTIAVGTEVDILITATKNAICAGDLVNLDAQITLNTGETLLWKKDGVEMTETGTTITGQYLTATTEYTVELLGGSCDGNGTITITVSTPVVPQLEISDDVICLGSVIDITDTNPQDAASYVWESRTGTGNWTTMTQTSKNLTGIAPEVTTTYRKTAINGECTRVSNEVMVRVEPPLNFNVSPNVTICSGATTTLTMSNFPVGSTTEWFEGLNLIEQAPSIEVTPLVTTTYTAKVTDICTATRQVTVTVDAPITASISAPTTICLGDNTQLVATGGTTYRWTPATGLNNPNISNPIASPSVTTVYSVEITRGTCSYVTETTVTVVPLPVITNIEETNVREVTAYVENGLPPYSYSINNRDFITHNVLHDVSIGGHILYVVDMNNCKTSRPFEVTPIPIFPAKFFTPNDDGVNDYWTIENLNVYPSYIVQIFDRFGKLIYEVRSGQFHADGEVNSHPFQWDGNYLGHPLPSTDYWYLITLEEVRKQYTGHFTLKR